jgi:hypothetical protein
MTTTTVSVKKKHLRPMKLNLVMCRHPLPTETSVIGAMSNKNIALLSKQKSRFQPIQMMK